MKKMRLYSFRKDFELCFILWISPDFLYQCLEILKKSVFSHYNLYPVSENPTSIPAGTRVIEICPKIEYASARSSKSIRQFHNMGIEGILRCEEAKRYFVPFCVATEEFLKTLSNYDPMLEDVYEGETMFVENDVSARIDFPAQIELLSVTKEEGIEHLKETGMNLSQSEYWYNYFVSIEKRNPTFFEISTIVFGYTEHSKHPHTVNIHSIDGIEYPSLIDVIKEPYMAHPGTSVIAFHDNASATRGFHVDHLLPKQAEVPAPFMYVSIDMDSVAKAETHNFPTGISPRPGAETGVGGLMRDVYINGIGAYLTAVFNIIGVGALRFSHYQIPGQDGTLEYPPTIASENAKLIQGSDGICDYPNQHGTPGIMGALSSAQFLLNGKRIEYLKPLAFIGGIGVIPHKNIEKKKLKSGTIIIGLGGPIYPVGFGGGLASSKAQGTQSIEKDKSAVQRGDAHMARRVHNLLVSCTNDGLLNNESIIAMGNDQGAAGVCNALIELIASVGAKVNLRQLHLGADISPIQSWLSEAQERFIVAIDKENVPKLLQLSRQEGLEPEILGEVVPTGRILVYDGDEASILMDMQLSAFDHADKKIIEAKKEDTPRREFVAPEISSLKDILKATFAQLGVASKNWIVQKGDQTVGGRTVRHQYSGPRRLTINDTGIVKMSVCPSDYHGICFGLGFKPNTVTADPQGGALQVVAEALCNLVAGAPPSLELQDVAFLLNEMWACGTPSQNERLYRAIQTISDALKKAGLHINGGKDSLSFKTMVGSEVVNSPDTLVATAYATVSDVRNATTPYVKYPGKSIIGLVDFSQGNVSLTGSAIAQAYGEIGDTYPRIDIVHLLDGLQAVLDLKKQGLISASHDRCGDGIAIAFIEMILGGCGGGIMTLTNSVHESFGYLFAEVPGMLIEYLPENSEKIVAILEKYHCALVEVGRTTTSVFFQLETPCEQILIDEHELLKMMEQTSFEVNKLQMNKALASESFNNLIISKMPKAYHVPFSTAFVKKEQTNRPKVAILWDEGSNGIYDAAAFCTEGGFEAWNVSMYQLKEKQVRLQDFQMIFPVGGFSGGDVFGSAVGWAASILEDSYLRTEFSDFFARKDSIGFAPCNGFQLFSLLDRELHFMFPNVPLDQRPRLIHNQSGKFEASEVRVGCIGGMHSMFLKEMKDAQLSVAIAHGEGQICFSKKIYADMFVQRNLAPFRYLDTEGNITMKYPYNPNGSSHAIAGVVSENGRYLAMMPHPERMLTMENVSWIEGYSKDVLASPWLKIIDNAYHFLTRTKK